MHNSRVVDLLLLWEDRVARGEPADPADLCRDCPELLDELRRGIADLERANGAMQTRTGDRTGSVRRLETPPLPPELRDHPRYRVVQQLGQGGMGVVYRAEHRMMERLVVIKVINRALVDSPDTVERFNREVRAAAKLDHPNIVKAYDAEEAGGLQLLVMEYVEGKNLADVLAKKGPLPVAYASQCVRQVALGLQHAHALTPGRASRRGTRTGCTSTSMTAEACGLGTQRAHTGSSPANWSGDSWAGGTKIGNCVAPARSPIRPTRIGSA